MFSRCCLAFIKRLVLRWGVPAFFALFRRCFDELFCRLPCRVIGLLCCGGLTGLSWLGLSSWVWFRLVYTRCLKGVFDRGNEGGSVVAMGGLICSVGSVWVYRLNWVAWIGLLGFVVDCVCGAGELLARLVA